MGAPILLSTLIPSGSRHTVFWGYIAGAALMMAVAIAEIILGVDRRAEILESISMPLQRAED